MNTTLREGKATKTRYLHKKYTRIRFNGSAHGFSKRLQWRIPKLALYSLNMIARRSSLRNDLQTCSDDVTRLASGVENLRLGGVVWKMQQITCSGWTLSKQRNGRENTKIADYLPSRKLPVQSGGKINFKGHKEIVNPQQILRDTSLIELFPAVRWKTSPFLPHREQRSKVMNLLKCLNSGSEEAIGSE